MADDARPTELEIARYLSGELAPQDAARIHAWMDADAANRAHVEVARALWSRTADQPSDERVEEVWQTISARLGLERRAPAATEEAPLKLVRHSHPNLSRIVQRRRTTWIGVAAVAIAAAASLVFIARPDPRPAASTAAAEPTYREYATRNAQRAEVRLSDGTRVVIAPASRLRVPEDYGSSTRSLLLEGEAYFDVVHDETKPFTVRSPNTTTKDLGTAFAVTDYAGESTARVLVAEGEVAVLSPRDTIATSLQLLKPGDLARVTPAGRVTRTRVNNVQRRLAWVRGGLVFDDAPLAEAVRAISRWYDLDVRLGSAALERLRLNATIGDEPADDVLRLVALALDLRYERAAGSRAVTFYEKRGGTQQ